MDLLIELVKLATAIAMLAKALRKDHPKVEDDGSNKENESR